MMSYDEHPLAKQANEALSAFLQGYPWDSFITATFKRRVNYPRTAIEKVSRELFEHPSGRAFLAAEEHYLGGWHVHGLVKWSSPTDVSNHFAKIRLERLGFSRVESIRNIGGSAGYCAKYLLKTQADYEFYGYHW
jgi:hypothetical protein